MPQLILEFSSNIFEKNNLNNLFQECHSLLEEMLPTDIASCKSRAIECHHFYIGKGGPKEAFVHAALRVMPGRSLDTLKNVGENMMIVLKKYFESSFKKLNMQISLEIIELEKTYFKITS